MAVKEPRHPLEKRDLLHAEPTKTDKVQAVAAKLMSEQRYSEVVDYLEIAPRDDLIEQLEIVAIERGSPFLLKSVERLRDTPASPESWGKLAEKAQADERWIEAVRALQAAGREEAAEVLRQEKCPDYDPFKPLGK